MVRRVVFEDSSQRLRVAVSDEVVTHMFRLCNAHRTRETGGILIGSYSSDCTTAWVGEATDPPSDSTSGRDWFHRGKDGLKNLLHQRWHSEPRTHYVGEWHFHPKNVPWPSPQDENQMREVARAIIYDCAQPLLLIVSPLLEAHWVVNCFVFPGTGRSCQKLRIVDDGEFDGPEAGNRLRR